MQLEKIITLANQKTEIAFLAMERSLRATGCTLPIWVIPYDDDRFNLPDGSEWWVITEIIDWLAFHHAHPMMRKYQCLTVGNYQYIDCDVCFTLNPEEFLIGKAGFISSCGHWHNPSETITEQSERLLAARSTTWQSSVFNAGQFACDQPLYSIQDLIAAATQRSFIETCLHFKWHDQPGLNLLVNTSGIMISNLTLPPFKMESTWAGDYPDNFDQYWQPPERKPYLIHWAGGQLANDRPINTLFYKHLTAGERMRWHAERPKKRKESVFKLVAIQLKKAIRAMQGQ